MSFSTNIKNEVVTLEENESETIAELSAFSETMRFMIRHTSNY